MSNVVLTLYDCYTQLKKKEKKGGGLNDTELYSSEIINSEYSVPMWWVCVA